MYFGCKRGSLVVPPVGFADLEENCNPIGTDGDTICSSPNVEGYDVPEGAWGTSSDYMHVQCLPGESMLMVADKNLNFNTLSGLLISDSSPYTLQQGQCGIDFIGDGPHFITLSPRVVAPVLPRNGLGNGGQQQGSSSAYPTPNAGSFHCISTGLLLLALLSFR